MLYAEKTMWTGMTTETYPATLTIYKETVVTENWTIPYMMGEITPNNLRPHPKNPNIAAFFRQLEWMDDLAHIAQNQLPQKKFLCSAT